MSMTVNPPYLHKQLPYDSISNTQSHLLCANFTGWCRHILGHHLKRHLSQFLWNDTKAHRFGFTATHTDVKRGIGKYPVVQRLFQAQANLFCQRNKPLTLTMKKYFKKNGIFTSTLNSWHIEGSVDEKIIHPYSKFQFLYFFFTKLLH